MNLKTLIGCALLGSVGVASAAELPKPQPTEAVPYGYAAKSDLKCGAVFSNSCVEVINKDKTPVKVVISNSLGTNWQGELESNKQHQYAFNCVDYTCGKERVRFYTQPEKGKPQLLCSMKAAKFEQDTPYYRFTYNGNKSCSLEPFTLDQDAPKQQ